MEEIVEFNTFIFYVYLNEQKMYVEAVRVQEADGRITIDLSFFLLLFLPSLSPLFLSVCCRDR